MCILERCFFFRLDTGLAVRYNFESIENKRIEDNSDNGYQGIVEGQLELHKWTSQSCKDSMHFEQGTGYIRVETDGIQAQRSTSMTISVWVRVDKVCYGNSIWRAYKCAFYFQTISFFHARI